MHADIDSIQEVRGTEPGSAPLKLAKDTVLDALLNSSIQPPTKPHGHTKRRRSIRTTEDNDETHATNRERMKLELTRRASLVNEEACYIRAREMATGAYSSIPVTRERSTINGLDIDVGTTEGDPST